MDLLSPFFSASSLVLNLADVQLYSDSHQLAHLRENSQVTQVRFPSTQGRFTMTRQTQ